MRKIRKSTPDYESYEYDLIQHCLIKETYEVSISRFKLTEKSIEICTYSGSLIYLSEMYDIVPYRKHKKYYRKAYPDDYRILSDTVFMVYDCCRDIAYSNQKYKNRSDNQGKSIYPWSLYNQNSTDTISDEVLYCIRLTLEIERFEYEWVELMEWNHLKISVKNESRERYIYIFKIARSSFFVFSRSSFTIRIS